MADAKNIAAILCLLACEPQASERPAPIEPSLHAIWRGSTDRSAPIVVLLHGYGARGDDLVPLAESFAQRLPRVRFACLAAPLGGASGRFWWEFPDRGSIGRAAARSEVIEWLDANRSERVILAGFSQGAILSIDVALEWDRDVAGIGAFSGGRADGSRWPERLRRRAPSLFISHGRQDRVLPFEDAERIADEFRAAGADTRFVPFDGGHSMPPIVTDAFVEYVDARTP